MGHLNDDRIADFLVSSETTAVLLLSQHGKLTYRTEPLPGSQRAAQLLAGPVSGDGRRECVIGGRFIGEFRVWEGRDGHFRPAQTLKTTGPYFDMQMLDLNGDGRPDVITSGGDVFLRGGRGDCPRPRVCACRILPEAGPSWPWPTSTATSGRTWPC